jgi:hypothetical protein
MTGYATRVSTFATGDTIAAADSNDEFDALVTAFGTTGHTHDGTAGNGGNLAALRSHAITLGLGTAGTDVVVTFDGETNDGVLTWMEDEDHFKFTDDVLLNGTEKLLFNDTGTYIHSNADGDLDIVSDGTEVDSINLESAGGITLDAGTAASGIIYEDDGTEMLRVHNSSSDVILESKVSDKDIIFKGNDNGSGVTSLTLDMSDAGRVIAAGNMTVTGDLTISGDDLVMATNTAGHLLVGDGTNYNPVAVSGDVTMAASGAVTIANGAVENAMLADDAVGADELASNAVVNASVASGAAIAVNKTALVAGTNITLATNTLNVDDAFLINSGDDTTSGVITSAGYTANVAAGSGDVALNLQSGGTTKFVVGIDDSDSDIFKIHSSTALADTSDFEMTAAGVASFASTLNVGADLVVTGDLTVNGDTVTVNTATLSVEDPLIILASGNAGADTVDIGFYGLYDTSGSQDLYAGLFRDANDSGKFKLFKDLQAVPGTTVNTSGTGYAVGTLVANLEGGSVTGITDIVVADGGTGVSTLTDGGVLLGSGTGAITAMAVLTDGQMIVGDGTGDPVAESGATLRTSIGVGTGDSPQVTGIELGHASDTTITRVSSGVIAVEGANVVTGVSPQLTSLELGHASDTTITRVSSGLLAVEGVNLASQTGANAAKQTIAIACGDEVTATAAATAVVTFHMPYAFTLTGIKAGVTTAPVGSVLTVDLNEAGSTVLTTKLTIDAGEKTSGTAATAAVIGGAGPALADNALMTIDVDGVGSGTAGAGLKVYLIGYAT